MRGAKVAKKWPQPKKTEQKPANISKTNVASSDGKYLQIRNIKELPTPPRTPDNRELGGSSPPIPTTLSS